LKIESHTKNKRYRRTKEQFKKTQKEISFKKNSTTIQQKILKLDSKSYKIKEIIILKSYIKIMKKVNKNPNSKIYKLKIRRRKKLRKEG
jgi:hypothetical protein